MVRPLLAGIEAGGTKFVSAVATAQGEILERHRTPTTSPEETLDAVLAFFRDAALRHGPIHAAGVAAFGPLDLDPGSPGYGAVVTTPKPGWSDFNILRAVRMGLGVPTRLDTDVSCAALAEGRLGAAVGCDVHAYVTVGTGIGVGVVSNDRALVLRGHSEMGHIRVGQRADDVFAGRCPYHGDCLEGLACGPAMADRWGRPAEDLDDDHPAWALEAHYIASLCATLIYSVRPERIVIGGGVFERASLYPRVRSALSVLLNGYGLGPRERDLDGLIVPPGVVGAPPGLLGALELARRALPHMDAIDAA